MVWIPGESNAPDGLGDNSRTENSHVLLAPEAMGSKQDRCTAAKVSQHIEAEGVAGVELNEVVRLGVAPHCGAVWGKLASLSQALQAGMNVPRL